MDRIEPRFEIGDKVLLQLGADVKNAPYGLRRWDGCRFTIADMHNVITTGQNYYYIYGLKCCASPKGTPYSILEEWLTKV